MSADTLDRARRAAEALCTVDVISLLVGEINPVAGPRERRLSALLACRTLIEDLREGAEVLDEAMAELLKDYCILVGVERRQAAALVGDEAAVVDTARALLLAGDQMATRDLSGQAAALDRLRETCDRLRAAFDALDAAGAMAVTGE